MALTSEPSTIDKSILLDPLPDKSTLEAYIEEVKADTKLDEFSVKDVQLKLPGLKHKWVGRLIRTKATVHRLQRDKEVIKKKLAELYRHQAPVTVSLPTAEKAVENHDKIVDLSDKIHEHLLVIEFLEKVERIFSSMTYDIKNLVDLIKLETL